MWPMYLMLEALVKVRDWNTFALEKGVTWVFQYARARNSTLATSFCLSIHGREQQRLELPAVWVEVPETGPGSSR